MNSLRTLSMCAIVGVGLFAASQGHAALCDGWTAESDSRLQDSMGPLPSTINKFYPWHLKNYFIAENTKWQGVDNPGGLSDEYGKHLLSAYLVEHGVAGHITTSYFDLYDQKVVVLELEPSFYTSAYDWGPNTRATPPLTGCTPATRSGSRSCDRWHDTYVSVVEEYGPGHSFFDPGEDGAWWPPSDSGAWDWIQHNVLGVLEYEGVATYCGLYSKPDEAVYRASALVHEGWHSTEYAHGLEGHGPPNEKCVAVEGSEEACDAFVPPSGIGIPGGLRTARMGSYQAQEMFLCDISDAAQPWVPFEAQLLAEANYERWEGGVYTNIDLLPFECGMPTPLRGLTAGADRCPVPEGIGPQHSYLVCNTNEDCPDDEICGPSRCCYEDQIK